MDQSEILKKVLCEEALTPEEKQAHADHLEADPELARSLAGWQRFRSYLRGQVPAVRDFVLHSLVFQGHAEDLSDEEANEVSEKWQSLDPVIESHPGFLEVSAQIDQDREDFLQIWEAENPRTISRVLPLSIRTFRMAAAIAVLTISVVATLLLSRDDGLQTVTADPSEYERVLLPDGSEVHLNGPATLRFNEQDFSRTVELTGIAFFDIAHSSDQFSVQTKEAVARVLGTRFGMRSMNGLTQVVLESGRLEVASTAETPQSVMLVPGQMTSITEESTSPTPPVRINIEDQLGWTGFLFFQETSLRKAAVLLASSRNVRVDIDSTLINEKVTGIFAPDVSVEEILHALALTLNAEVVQEGEAYRIVP